MAEENLITKMSEYELRMEYNRLCDKMKELLEVADLGDFNAVDEIEPYRLKALEVHRQYKLLYWQNEKENLEKRKEEYQYKDTFDLEVSIKTHCKSILKTLEHVYEDLQNKFGMWGSSWPLDGCAYYNADIKCAVVEWTNVVYMLEELRKRNVIKRSPLGDHESELLDNKELEGWTEFYDESIDWAIRNLKLIVSKKVQEGSVVYDKQAENWFLVANSHIVDLENVNERILSELQGG